MENESEDFMFDSEDSSNQQPFIMRVKKTYTEEYSIIPNYKHWQHYRPNQAGSCYSAYGRTSNNANMPTSQSRLEPQVSCCVPDIESTKETITIVPGVNSQLVRMPQDVKNSKLPKLSVLFPEMFAHRVEPTYSGPSLETSVKSISEMIGLEILKSVPTNLIYDVKNCQKVPVLVSPAKETATMCKFTNSSISGNVQETDCPFNKLQSADTLDISTNMTRAIALLMSKNQQPIIQRKLLNCNIKGLSPWPEMPLSNANLSSNYSKEFDFRLDSEEYVDVILKQLNDVNERYSEVQFQERDENKLWNSENNREISSKASSDITIDMGNKDIILNAAGDFTSISEMGLSVNTNHSQTDSAFNITLSPASWIEGIGSNPLQIPWPEIMKEIAYDGEDKWLDRVLIEDVEASLKMASRSVDFPTDLVGQSAQPQTFTNKNGIQQMANEAQIVPESFETRIYQEKRIEKASKKLEHSFYLSESHLEHTNDPINTLEHHNDGSLEDSRIVVPLSSSPWSVDQFNMSIVELEQHCSPVDAVPAVIDKTIANTRLLENKPENDDFSKFIEESEEDMDDVDQEEASAGMCRNRDCGHESSLKEEAHTCPGEAELESNPNAMDADSAAIDQIVPNPCSSMKSSICASTMAHTFEFEEFYSNSSLKKRVKTSRMEGSSCRPLRLGLSKKRRVNPLHDLKNFRKD